MMSARTVMWAFFESRAPSATPDLPRVLENNTVRWVHLTVGETASFHSGETLYLT